MKRIGIIAVCDFVSLPNGGEVFLLNNFLSAHSNPKVNYYLIGMTFNPNDKLGEWNRVRIGDKIYEFFPVAKILKDKEQTHIPFRLRVVTGIYKYWPQIRGQGIDEIYIHSAELGIPFWNKNISMTYHVHGDPGQTLRFSRFAAFRGSLWSAMYYRLIRKTINRSKMIIWAANRSKELYLEAQPQMVEIVNRKSCVIHSSFDTKLRVSDNYHIELSNRIHLVTVARLAAIKRIDFLIECIADLVKDGYDVDFLICGDGEEKENLKKLAEDLGICDRILFLGLMNKEQIANVLTSSEVFLFASENEAMSLVVLESLYMGVPVVSTDVGDIRDAVVDGRTGYLVKGYNHNIYSSRIKELITNGKAKYTEACIKMSLKYTPERMAEEIDKVFI